MSRYQFEFPTSEFQEGIFDFVSEDPDNGDTEHGVVNAVAGSGKTYSLMCCAQLLGERRGHFFAFNTHIAQELGRKLKELGAPMSSSTIHAAGRGCVADHPDYAAYSRSKRWVNGRKYGDIVKGVFSEMRDEGRIGKTAVNARLVAAIEDEYPLGEVRRLADLVRGNLLDPRDDDGIYDLVSHHGMVFHPDVYDALPLMVREVVMRGLYMVHEIDFTDMIWLPTVKRMRPRQHEWVFVDEAQDLNKAQFALVRKCVKPGGRMLFVGDRNQAIYGFAGADCNSFSNIIEATGAKELPLSVCYRCPKTHIQLAKQIVPQIEWAADAKEGEILNTTEEKLHEMVKEGDLVLCRTNAPLLRTCYKLIAEGVPAKVRGRKIGEGLVKITKEVRKKARDFDDFSRGLEDWEREQIQKIDRQKGDNDGAKAIIYDKVACLRVVYGATMADSYETLAREINNLFSDERESVTLSTVHKAKGLEADRVFILKPELMPHPMAKQSWELEQEMNLKYVALTRAKDTLVFVHEGRIPPLNDEDPDVDEEEAA